jgi:ElaB/YqjD/DUF883 family membrane-anchored ribosome-binding protein
MAKYAILINHAKGFTMQSSYSNQVDTADDIRSRASNEFSNLKADLNDLVSRIPSLSEIDLQAAKDKLLDKYESSRISARAYAADAREKLNHGVEIGGEYVKERPLQSIALAAGVGLLLGALISRR